MNIYPIQQSIVSKLQADFTAASTNFQALDLPDTQNDYKAAIANPIAYVVYAGSQAVPSVSTNAIVQPRKLVFNVECCARSLYREDGVYALRDVVEQSLIGFRPQNCQRMYLQKDDIMQEEATKIWVHVYQFVCDTMLVQKDDDEPIIVPEFKEIISPE